MDKDHRNPRINHLLAVILQNDGDTAGAFGEGNGQPTCEFDAAVRYAEQQEFGVPGVPFGGFKESGYGREQSIEALDLYTETKAVLQGTSPKPINPFGV